MGSGCQCDCGAQLWSYVQGVRSGIGSRVLLLLVGALCITLSLFSALILIGQQRTPNERASDIPRDLVTAMVIVGGIGAVVALVGYLVLAELQAQTAAAFGPNRRRAAQPLPPPVADEAGGRRTIARHDSWS